MPGQLPSVKYEGEFKDDVQDGLGIEESPYYSYFGKFSNDKKLGKGLEQITK